MTRSAAARAGLGAVASRSALRRALVGLAVLFVLAMTLAPAQGAGEATLSYCYLCEAARPPDVIRNVALFVPLGLALAGVGVGTRRATHVGVFLSAGVEALQLWIPGRESSLSDVVCNGAGTVLGCLLAREWRAWLAPPARLSSALSLAAALAVGALVAITGWLLTPVYSAADWYAGFAPDLGHFGRYRGEVRSVTLGGVALASGRLDTGPVRDGLRAGERLAIRASAAPPSAVLAPLFTLFDADRNEVYVVGEQYGDLVLRQRTRAADLRFEQPSLQLPGALRGLAPGEDLAIDVWREDGRPCVELNGERSCGLGFSAWRGWAFLFRLREIPYLLRQALDALWLAAIAFPVALWCRRSGLSVLAVAVLAAALLLLPAQVGLVRPSALEAAGLAGGLVAGALASQAVRRRFLPGR